MTEQEEKQNLQENQRLLSLLFEKLEIEVNKKSGEKIDFGDHGHTLTGDNVDENENDDKEVP